MGLLLVVLAGAAWSLERLSARSPAPASQATLGTGAAGDQAPTIVLNPTAAAVATALPRPAALPTAGPAPTRQSAAVRLVISSLGVDLPVVEVGWHVRETADGTLGEWETVAGAVGFHRGSADPGEAGNCVLSGHSSIEGASGLSELYRIPIGDRIVLYNGRGISYTYVTTKVLTVDEVGASTVERRDNARLLDPTDQPVLTLVTCWPDWSYTSRIVVQAELRGPN